MIAYNKMDLPDSADYWEDIKAELMAHGIPAENILSLSSATGDGVRDLVRRLHTVLDTLPDRVSTLAQANKATCASSLG